MIQLAIPLAPRAVVPDAGTQCGRALRAMQSGVRLTIWNAMVDYGIGALHQRIFELKTRGWPVQRREVVKNGKRVAEFWMDGNAC